ncbi:MAG: T9SS type A sorting domain-containing protein, partial [Bacteroidota bacterium]
PLHPDWGQTRCLVWLPENTGPAITGGTTTTVDFYCDADQSGGYSPGDPLLGTYNTTAGIAPGTPHNFNGNFFISSAMCNDSNMIYGLIVPNSAGGYCICDTAFGNTNAVLPVRWLEVRGKALEAENEIRWSAELLPGHSHFLVERRENGDWRPISTPQTAQVQDHVWLDEGPGLEEWYRIRAVDQNGEWHHSEAVMVERDVEETVRVYPNPAMDRLFLEARVVTDFVLYDALGKEISAGTIELAGPVELDIRDLRAGVYFVAFSYGTRRVMERVVVE